MRRWVGLAVSVAGTVIAAPDGLDLILSVATKTSGRPCGGLAPVWPVAAVPAEASDRSYWRRRCGSPLAGLLGQPRPPTIVRETMPLPTRGVGRQGVGPAPLFLAPLLSALGA
jgi:hypothetical protein